MWLAAIAVVAANHILRGIATVHMVDRQAGQRKTVLSFRLLFEISGMLFFVTNIFRGLGKF
jgi:hypothetical protein